MCSFKEDQVACSRGTHTFGNDPLGYIGIMENKPENYHSILELYTENGQENGNHYRDYKEPKP